MKQKLLLLLMFVHYQHVAVETKANYSNLICSILPMSTLQRMRLSYNFSVLIDCSNFCVFLFLYDYSYKKYNLCTQAQKFSFYKVFKTKWF